MPDDQPAAYPLDAQTALDAALEKLKTKPKKPRKSRKKAATAEIDPPPVQARPSHPPSNCVVPSPARAGGEAGTLTSDQSVHLGKGNDATKRHKPWVSVRPTP